MYIDEFTRDRWEEIHFHIEDLLNSGFCEDVDTIHAYKMSFLMTTLSPKLFLRSFKESGLEISPQCVEYTMEQLKDNYRDFPGTTSLTPKEKEIIYNHNLEVRGLTRLESGRGHSFQQQDYAHAISP